MRNRLNKKGFSLIELLVVVVIMGILVAAAVPLYSAITDKANANTCQTNQRLIKSSFAKWVLMDEKNTTDNLFITSEKSFDGSSQSPEDVFDERFLAMFDSNDFPACPEEGNYYVVSASGDLEITVTCYKADGSSTGHHE